MAVFSLFLSEFLVKVPKKQGGYLLKFGVITTKFKR